MQPAAKRRANGRDRLMARPLRGGIAESGDALELAEFAAELPDRNGEGKHEVLRLLARPLDRYDLDQGTHADPPLRDGAIFAFVMGTDPEVVLLLEAVERAERTVWQYAFARATGWGAEARLDDQVLWSVGADPVSRDPANTQIQLRRPLP